jgi:hypothetical protein
MHSIFDPQMSEWGNPITLKEERTEGSEPSQYLEEKKTKVIPSVAASESGQA